MSSKLRIRIGEVEIDYEGTEEFLKQELPQLLKTAMELYKAAGTEAHADTGGTVGKGHPGHKVHASTGSIASKIDSKDGSDLLLAAAGNLSLSKHLDTFSRKELLDEMKSATAYYKKNYATNLSSYIKTALKDDRLSEVSSGRFALTASARSDLESKLAHS